MPVAVPVLPTFQPWARRASAAVPAAPDPPNPFSTSTVTERHAAFPVWKGVEVLPVVLVWPPPWVGGLVVGALALDLGLTLDSAHSSPPSATTRAASAVIRESDGAPKREGMPCDSRRRANHSSRCSSSGSFWAGALPGGVSTRAIV